jgi:hypothetical protein
VIGSGPVTPGDVTAILTAERVLTARLTADVTLAAHLEATS